MYLIASIVKAFDYFSNAIEEKLTEDGWAGWQERTRLQFAVMLLDDRW